MKKGERRGPLRQSLEPAPQLMGSIPEQPEQQEYFNLRSTSIDGRPQFRAYAELMFDYVQEMGFPEMDKLHVAPVGIPVEPPEETTEAGDMGLSRMFLDNGQEIVLLFGTERSPWGHKGIVALSRKQAQTWLVGSRAETAVIAATTVMQAKPNLKPIDIPRLRHALSLIEGPLIKSAEEHAKETTGKMLDAVDAEYDYGRRDYEGWSKAREPALRFQADLQISTLEYVLALLRYRKPNFDDYSRREQHELVWRACERVNALWEAAEELGKFLEYGSPAGLPNKIADRNRDVRAVVLKDVVGLTHREIGEELGVPLPQSEITGIYKRGTHGTVGKMVKRGRDLLHEALGEDGWRERAAVLKADMDRYNALSKTEQTAERLAEYWGVSRDEAQERYLRETNQYAKTLSAAMGVTEQEALEILNQPD